MAAIDEELVEYFKQNPTGNILVELREKTAPITAGLAAQSFPTKGDRANAVHSTLTKFTAESQKNVLAFLEKTKKEEKPAITFEGLWISNKVIVKGADFDLVEKLALVPEIEKIHGEKRFELHRSLVKAKDTVKIQLDTVERKE